MMGTLKDVRTRWTRVLLASTLALGVTTVFAGTAGADTSPHAPDAACIGSSTSTSAQYFYNYDELLGTRAEFYRAAAIDPEFWDQYNVKPGMFGNDPTYGVSAFAKSGNMDYYLQVWSGCG
jgi:hypothetical protein